MTTLPYPHHSAPYSQPIVLPSGHPHNLANVKNLPKWIFCGMIEGRPGTPYDVVSPEFRPKVWKSNRVLDVDGELLSALKDRGGGGQVFIILYRAPGRYLTH